MGARERKARGGGREVGGVGGGEIKKGACFVVYGGRWPSGAQKMAGGALLKEGGWVVYGKGATTLWRCKGSQHH